MTKTPIQYARQQIAEGKFPSMPVLEIAGSFYLCDAEWNILPRSKSYARKEIAIWERSKIIERAAKA